MLAPQHFLQIVFTCISGNRNIVLLFSKSIANPTPCICAFDIGTGVEANGNESRFIGENKLEDVIQIFQRQLGVVFSQLTPPWIHTSSIEL